MRKLSLYTGGHPVTLDDFMMLQNAIIENFKALIAGLLPSSVTRCILNGCVYDSGTGVLTEGAIYYNGEIYLVDEQTISGTLYWVKVTTIGPLNPVVYLDSVSHDVHLIETFALQAGSGLFAIGDIDRLENLLGNKIKTVLGLASLTEVTTLFATLRNGYDPILRVSPTNVLEWAYASPSHPSLPGTAGNPWHPLGISVVTFATGTLGLFDVKVSSPFLLPDTFNFAKIVEFNEIIEDEGGAFVLDRKYVAPLAGTYEFVFEDLILEVVSDIPPHTFPIGEMVTAKIVLAMYKNGAPFIGVPIASLEATSETYTDALDGKCEGLTIGTEIIVNPRHLQIGLLEGDEITVTVMVTEFTSNAGINDTKRQHMTNNFRTCYRLSSVHLYTV